MVERGSPSTGRNPFSSLWVAAESVRFDKRARAGSSGPRADVAAQPCGETEEFWQSPARIKIAPVKTLPSGPYFTDTTYSAARVPSFFGAARRAEIICGIHARPRWPLAIEYTFRRELMPNSADSHPAIFPTIAATNLEECETCSSLQRVSHSFSSFPLRLCSSPLFFFYQAIVFFESGELRFFFFVGRNFC